MDSILLIAEYTVRLCYIYLEHFAALLATVTVFGIVYYWSFRRSFAHIPSYSVEPGLFYDWATGKFPENIPFSSYFFNWTISLIKRFEKKGLILMWGIQPYLIICNEEYTKVFANEPEAVNKPRPYTYIEELFGKGLLTSNGSTWKVHRKLLNPAFSFEMLKSHVSVFNRGANEIVKNLAETCNKPTDEVLHILKIYTLKIFSETTLGIKLNDERYDSKIYRYLELLSRLGKYTVYRFPRPWLYWKYSQLLFQAGREHRKLYTEFNNFVKDVIEEIKVSVSAKASEDSKEELGGEFQYGKSFTHILLEHHMKDPSFTMEDVLGQVNLFIFAGHDTTSYTILWCLFLLALHQDVQENAFLEIESVAGNSASISYGQLSKLTYLERVIKETLRIYPVVPFYGRQTTNEIQCGKYKVPKNTIIIFSPYIMHRNPNIFPDPEKFDPERFNGNSKKHPWSFTPFSEGIRSCIGKKYAMLEMKTILAHILLNFKVTSLDKREDVDLDWNLILSPLKPLRFHFTRRHRSHSSPQG